MNSYILKLIQQGEHQQQDFKFCINDSKKIAKSLVAFANTDGGRLLIGVKDNGNIAGISSDEEFYMVEGAATLYSKPKIKFDTKQWNIDGKTILEIKIEPSKEKPHFAIDETGKWVAYIRKNVKNILASRIQVEVWNKKKSPEGIFFTYSNKEKFLIEYLLNNPSITLSKLIRLAHISREKAIDLLSNFVLMEIISLEMQDTKTFFYLNQNFDKAVLNKFK